MSQDVAYVNPSHVILRPNGAGSDQYYLRTVNPPHHPGDMPVPMPQHYVLPDQRRIERVPRQTYLSPHYESVPSITFSTNGFPGVRVKDVSRVVIDAAHDAVLEPHKFRSIVISIQWPGYDSCTMRARIDALPGGMCITRQDLAREICGLLTSFHTIASKHPISPDMAKWALTSDRKGIRVSDIVLFSLHYYRNVWVPEFYVIE